MAVVLVLVSVFLHVKISVKVFRVWSLVGMVTSFWSTFVLGGGGNVTFHDIQDSAGMFYY